MTKKIQTKTRVSKPPALPKENTEFNSTLREQQKMLTDIQGKIFRSPALNGGFDAMMFKMEALETNSKITAAKVDSIHECLFDPDDGLYARVKDSASSDSVDDLHRSVLEIQMWKETQQKSLEKDEVDDNRKSDIILQHEQQLADFKLWKERITSIGKWFVVSLGGAMIALIFKLIYDFVKGHIQIV